RAFAWHEKCEHTRIDMMHGGRYTPECLQIAQAWPPERVPRSNEARVTGKSLRVFRSPWIERTVSRAHPITPIIWFGPFIGWAVFRAIATLDLRLSAVALFAAGWLVWSLLEYLLHRFVFHMGAHTPEQR